MKNLLYIICFMLLSINGFTTEIWYKNQSLREAIVEKKLKKLQGITLDDTSSRLCINLSSAWFYIVRNYQRFFPMERSDDFMDELISKTKLFDLDWKHEIQCINGRLSDKRDFDQIVGGNQLRGFLVFVHFLLEQNKQLDFKDWNPLFKYISDIFNNSAHDFQKSSYFSDHPELQNALNFMRENILKYCQDVPKKVVPSPVALPVVQAVASAEVVQEQKDYSLLVLKYLDIIKDAPYMWDSVLNECKKILPDMKMENYIVTLKNNDLRIRYLTILLKKCNETQTPMEGLLMDNPKSKENIFVAIANIPGAEKLFIELIKHCKNILKLSVTDLSKRADLKFIYDTNERMKDGPLAILF